MSLLLSDLIARVRVRINEPVAGRWADADIITWTNEGIGDIARRTRHLQTEFTVVLSANVNEYILPSTLVALNYVYWLPGDGRRVPLNGVTPEQIDMIWGSNQNNGNSGNPSVYTVWGYAPNLKLKLYPPPAAAGNLLILGSKVPAEILQSVNPLVTTVDMVEGWIPMLIDYVEYMALRQGRDPRFQESQAAYEQKLDSLITMNDYAALSHQIVPGGSFGGVQRYLYDPDW